MNPMRSETPKVRHWKRWIIAGAIAIPAAVVGGPFVYINFIEGDAPAPLRLIDASPTTTTTGTVPLDGAWAIASGSRVGYRVKEVLFGQSNTAAGRTTEIEGSLTFNGTTLSAATFTVDMTSVSSDQSRRDRQFDGRIMDTSTYPTATFKLTQPITLASIPAEGVTGTARATGELTLRGTTKTVTFTVTGRRTGSSIQVSGSIPIVFADWNIPNPSFGGVVTTEDNGTLEFLLTFAHA
ncbi:MAG: YceI family protein [Actinomycetota bacterium]